jgi:heme-degrading monooxygenase HmoA
MVRATIGMTVKAGCEGEFEQAWRQIAEQVRRVPGNLRQSLLRDANNPSEFVLTSDWESREAFSRFERSQEQDRLTAPLRGLRESARMTIHQLVVHLEAETQ